MNREELIHKLAAAASMVKLVTGVANNTAILIMLDAHDKIKQHPRYKRPEVKHAYKRALKEWHKYEARLLYAYENRFFCVEDMSPATRKIYGDITDQQYFEFWKGLGDNAYTQTRPLVTSLWNKYRLSLLNHKVANPDLLAWPMAALACLTLAVHVYEEGIKDCIENQHLPATICRRIFRDFSLEPLLRLWINAANLTDPTAIFDLDDVEEKNINLGVLQLAEAWANPELLYDSAMKVIPDYAELFRTKGEMKKAMRQISEIRGETEANL